MKRLLLDTCTLLWFLMNDPRLTAPAKVAIEDPINERRLSPISLLEIALKVRLGKLRLQRPFGSIFPSELTANDIRLLPLHPAHIEPLTILPLYHRDPFDRLLAATALAEGFVVVSADTAFDAYGLTRLW